MRSANGYMCARIKRAFLFLEEIVSKFNFRQDRRQRCVPHFMDHNILFVQKEKKISNLAAACRYVLKCLHIFLGPHCIEICNFNISNNIVTCQPFVGLRNRALLGSRQLNASRPNTCPAAVGEALFAPCRAVPSRTAPSAATQQAR
jgi:hypothetical protein